MLDFPHWSNLMNSTFAKTMRRVGLLICLLPAGCGARPAAINDKVEGSVTIDGAPLAQVMVQFIPDAGPGVTAPASTGFTDAEGRYQLTYDRQKTGAAVGKHRVVLLQGRAGVNPDDPQAPVTPPPPGPRLPQEYALSGQTPLRVEVTSEKHTYDLNVTARTASGTGAGRDD
jgi:hypothetical protein